MDIPDPSVELWDKMSPAIFTEGPLNTVLLQGNVLSHLDVLENFKGGKPKRKGFKGNWNFGVKDPIDECMHCMPER